MCRKVEKPRMSHIANEMLFKNKGGRDNCQHARNLVRSCNVQSPLPSDSRTSVEDFPMFALDKQRLFQDLRNLGCVFPFCSVQCNFSHRETK